MLASSRTPHPLRAAVVVTGLLILACGGLPTGDECPPLSLDATEARSLLTSWQGNYHMRSWCAVGDCPPGVKKPHQLIIDPDTLTITWTDGTATVRQLNLSEGCTSGISTTGWDFHAGAGFIGTHTAPDGEKTQIQLGCNATEPDKVCSVSFAWEDPSSQQDYGSKIFNGMIGLNTAERTLVDFPEQGVPRSRSVDSPYREEIWLGP